MPFSISPVLPCDIPYLSSIQWAALLRNPLVQTLYPQGPTSALTAFTIDSYRRALEYPTVRLIKAVDDESGEIVGFAKWIVYAEEDHLSGEGEGEGEMQDRGWRHGKNGEEDTPRPEGVNERALGAWNEVITRTRKKVMRSMAHKCNLKGGCSLHCYFGSIASALWVLDIIHTHPLHQYRGVGTSLLEWGTEHADKLRLQCYVESPAAGHALFHKHDFVYITDMEIDLNEYRTHQHYYNQKYKHTVMIRPPETPPRVPPKKPNRHNQRMQGEWDFGFLDSNSSVGSEYGVRRKASLIEIRRSPRPDRSLKPDHSGSSGHSSSVLSSSRREMAALSPGPVEHITETFENRDP